MGVGFMCFVPAIESEKMVELISNAGFPAAEIGKVVQGKGTVKIKGIDL